MTRAETAPADTWHDSLGGHDLSDEEIRRSSESGPLLGTLVHRGQRISLWGGWLEVASRYGWERPVSWYDGVHHGSSCTVREAETALRERWDYARRR